MHGKTILLVEDEALIAMLEAQILKRYGARVIVANSGEKALEKLSMTPEVDLVLMDIDLGDGQMDGTQAAALILQQRDLPVIFLSGHTEREVVEKTEGISSYGYIVKNSGETILIASIKMAFRLFDARTKERQKELALQASEAQTRALLEAVPDLIFRMDREGVFLGYKADPEDLYAQGVDTIIGRRCREISPPEFADLIEHQIALTLDTRQMQEFEYQLPLPGRGVRDYEARMIASGPDAVTAIVRDVTERKQAETALAHSEHKFAAAFQRAPALMAISTLEDGRYISLNDAAVQTSGFTREEAIGKTSIELGWLRAEDRQRMMEALRQHGRAVDLEVTLYVKDGRMVDCLCNQEIITLDGQPYLLTLAQDITAQKQAAQALQYSERKYRAVVDALSEGIVLHDRSGAIVTCNRAAEGILGLTSAQMLGKTSFDPFWQAIHEDGSPFPGETHPAMVTLACGEPQHNVTMGVHKPDGTLTWISVDTRPVCIASDDQPDAVLACFTDITRWKESPLTPAA